MSTEAHKGERGGKFSSPHLKLRYKMKLKKYITCSNGVGEWVKNLFE